MAVFYISGEEPTSTHHTNPITNHVKSLYWDNKPNLPLLEVLKVHSGEILLIREMIFPNDQVVSLLNGKPQLGRQVWEGEKLLYTVHGRLPL